jgi:hypothetical protein
LVVSPPCRKANPGGDPALVDWLEANWWDVLVEGIIGLASFIVPVAGRRILLRWWLRQLVVIRNQLATATRSTH